MPQIPDWVPAMFPIEAAAAAVVARSLSVVCLRDELMIFVLFLPTGKAVFSSLGQSIDQTKD